MSSYNPQNRYKWRKSLLALCRDIWVPLTWFGFLLMLIVAVFYLMRMGPLVWIFASLFGLPFVGMLSKQMYDWAIDSYEVEGRWLKTTQRTSFQLAETDEIPLSSISNVELKLEGILGATLKLVGTIQVIAEGFGMVEITNVPNPERVRDILRDAAEYWRNAKDGDGRPVLAKNL